MKGETVQLTQAVIVGWTELVIPDGGFRELDPGGYTLQFSIPDVGLSIVMSAQATGSTTVPMKRLRDSFGNRKFLTFVVDAEGRACGRMQYAPTSPLSNGGPESKGTGKGKVREC